MKRILRYIFVPAAALCLSACLGDNHPQPDAAIFGKVIDAETGENILQDIGSEGSQIEMIELGYETKTSRYLNFKTDGTYRDNNMFKGEYSFRANRTNFLPLEETILKVSGPTEFNIKTKPYCRIHVESIELNVEKQKVYARFSVERTTDDDVKEVALFCDESPHVSYSINNSGEKSCRVAVNSKVSPDKSLTIKMPLTVLDTDKDYWFRVGALTSVKEAKYNYSQAVKIHIVKVEKPQKEYGITWDIFKHFEYWAPHKTIANFVWDDKDYKTAPGSIAATSQDQGGPGYTQFITPPEDGGGIRPRFDLSVMPIEGAHMLLTMYVSDASHFEMNANGQIEISSAGIYDQEELCWTFAQFELRSGWQTLDLALNEANVMGEFRPSKLDWFRVYHLRETGPTTLKFDNIKFYYKTLVDDCEDEKEWSSQTGVELDEGDCMQGESSVITKSAGTKFEITKAYSRPYYVPTPKNGGNMRFWLHVSDASAFNAGEKGRVTVSSSSAKDQNSMSWELPNVSDGWNLVVLKFSDAESVGSINLKKVNWFNIEKPVSGEVTVKVDAIRYYKDGFEPEDEEI